MMIRISGEHMRPRMSAFAPSRTLDFTHRRGRRCKHAMAHVLPKFVCLILFVATGLPASWRGIPSSLWANRLASSCGTAASSFTAPDRNLSDEPFSPTGRAP